MLDGTLSPDQLEEVCTRQWGAGNRDLVWKAVQSTLDPGRTEVRILVRIFQAFGLDEAERFHEYMSDRAHNLTTTDQS